MQTMLQIRRSLLILLILALINPSRLPAATEQRTALIIGNSAYSSGPLKNPVNDASDMAAMLKELGFTVTLKKDAKLQEMDEAIEAFGNSLKRGGVGLFYYAGHGVQVNGINYLLPIGARINKESDVKYQAVDANKILDEMASANNGLNIVMLDACRDNPFARSFRMAARGLAIVSSAPSGTFVSYSTSPGNVAMDGEGRNSPYTQAVLENIAKPGLSINNVFMNVRSKVKRETGQIPWELSSLEIDFYFVIQGSRVNILTNDPSYSTKSDLKTEVDELARQKALDAEREQLAAERRKFEAERTKVEAEVAAKAKARAEEIERDKAAQISKAKAEAITKPAEPEQKFTNSIGMTFVYIKPGTFMMGSPSDELGRDNDETQHQVTLTKGFYMQTTEVTQGQWQAVMGNNPSHFKNCGDDCPVESVSWDDVQEFIWRLNQKEGGSSNRLPTEAEWEYACRAGTNTRFSFGDSESQLSEYAWYDGGVFFGKAYPVARKQPNSWRPYDMHGNVKEWCQDWYGIYSKGNVTDPAGPSRGSDRVYRGGSWFDYAVDCRSANRDYFTPDFRSYNIGFRLSMTPLSEQVEQSVAIVQKPATVAAFKVKQGQIGFEPTTAAIAPPAAPAKETARDGRFIAYDNGIILDTRTNLMWAAKDNGSEITWWDAKSYCDNYSGGGYTDWRMPTHNELAGLYDEDKTYQSECRGFFSSTWDIHLTELIRLSCISVWTWETRGSEFAYFSFNTGKRYWNLQSFDINKLSLPVRSDK